MLNPFTPNPFQMPGAGSMFDTPPQTLDEFLRSPVPLGAMNRGFDYGYGLGGRTMQFNPQAQLDPSQVNLWLGQNNPWNGWMAGQVEGMDPINPRPWYDPLATPGNPYTFNSYPWGQRFDEWGGPGMFR